MNLFDPPQNTRERYVRFAGRIAKVAQASIAAMTSDPRQRHGELAEEDDAWALGLILAAWHLNSDLQIAVMVPTFALQWIYQRLEEVSGLRVLTTEIDQTTDMGELVELGPRFAVQVPVLAHALGGPERRKRLTALVRALFDAYPLSLYASDPHHGGTLSLGSKSPHHLRVWEWLRDKGYSPDEIQAISQRRVRFS